MYDCIIVFINESSFKAPSCGTGLAGTAQTFSFPPPLPGRFDFCLSFLYIKLGIHRRTVPQYLKTIAPHHASLKPLNLDGSFTVTPVPS
ncbi:hypothetical protein AVEN_210823-1 [Araneus ventricosus]|uniref:Uncharacterized protein n=1 Tax=Araneus ventricosus TaxID=182803 RepID=A0A4Y2BA69_ARAVE|nr:hypothetical protein AVEN_210823-1 [Araneus ventricosus]